jgi:hypothetical protein
MLIKISNLGELIIALQRLQAEEGSELPVRANSTLADVSFQITEVEFIPTDRHPAVYLGD